MAGRPLSARPLALDFLAPRVYSESMSRSAIVPADEEIPFDFDIEKYIDYRILGFTPHQASVQAGYRSKNDYLKWESDPYVQERLKKAALESRREVVYTRDKVMEVIERAVDMAEIQGDPRSMIAGAQEFNKMQGYYAPEKREVQLNVEHEIRVKQIQEMDEQELLEALDREAPYIDAEFSELPEEVHVEKMD